MKPQSTKAKGTRLEKWVSDQLQKLGVSTARRQPGSGVYQGFPHDVFYKLPPIGRVIVECKNWKHGWRTGNNAIGAADLLVIKADRDTPYVYCTWDHYAALVKTVVSLQEELNARGGGADIRGAGVPVVDGFVALGDRLPD